MKNKLIALKNLFVILFSTIFFSASATNYYVSANGNDANNGTSTSTPWQTINKLNSFKGFGAGDNVYFRSGDTFYGGIIVNNSGITYGSYGSGNQPIITGFTTVSSWTNLGGNIWESSNSVSSLSSCNMVTVNGVNTAMGRYPNSGYLPYQSFSGNISITSSSLTGSTNWAGAEVVIRKKRYMIDRSPITSQSGGTLYYNSGTTYSGQNNYGFFIQNDARTLDQQNEWYFNSSTGKIRIFSNSAPGAVQVSSVEYLVTGMYQNNISFSNLSFTGGNSDGFYIGSCANIGIQNCSIDFCNNGIMGISNGVASSNFSVSNSAINHSNNIAISLTSEFSNATITNNLIQNSGLIAGMAKIGDVSYQSIYTAGSNTTISYNEIDNSGYIGISFDGVAQLKNNLVNNYCLLKDDGAGIYTTSASQGSVIDNNIVLNAIGNGDGTPDPTVLQAEGIYLDSYANGIEVANNSVSNVPRDGIYLHNAKNVALKNNTVFNVGYMAVEVQDDVSSFYISGLTITGNIFFARDVSQMPARYYSLHNDLSTFGTLDNNYYARPLNDNQTIDVIPSGDGKGEYNYSLAQWQAFSGQDANSHKSPKSISDVSELRFEYNATTSNKTISLDANYIDVKGTSYQGSITLSPYTSAVLIRNGAITNGNIAPIANAGGNGTITLPSSSVILAGTGTDADGTITGYNWTKISGPSANISSPNSASTNITGMTTAGTYVFQLTVTDNNGATGTSTVQINVLNSGGSNNIAPVANAGGNGTITLPTSSVPLDGTGTDADGTITGYNWTKISGPSANISSPNSASTNITGMTTAGTYVFQLTVTDNNGATGTSTVQINVLNSGGSNNIAPVANAGGNGTITLPTSSVPLDGTGTDADGTITGYSWREISGPSADINSPNSASTNITGMMTAGTYVFQLTVTDNNGATGTSTVQINVLNSGGSNNIAPVANSGGNGTITLPTSSVRLDGTGADADGTITGYGWTEISGPSANINSPNSASTNITGMTTVGTYVFQLTVTDNNGATGTSTVQINVVNSNLSVSLPSITSTEIAQVPSSLIVTAYPNPFTNTLKITITGEAAKYKLIVINAVGETMLVRAGNKNSGATQLFIDGSKFSRGMYFLTLIQNNQSSTIKLEKQ